jgi:hypothetical protein
MYENGSGCLTAGLLSAITTENAATDLYLPSRPTLYQSGPTFFFPRAKNSVPVGPKGQETPRGNIFKTNRQFSFSFTILTQK